MEKKKSLSELDVRKQLLNTVEAALDANYHRFPLPHVNKAIATWYLLTVVEDSLRCLFLLTNDSQAPMVDFQLDRQKYSARFALDRIRKETTDASAAGLPAYAIPKTYTKTAELINAGIDFMAATQLCSAAHANTLYFQEKTETIDIVFDERHHDPQYSALEVFGHMPPNFLDHSANLYGWSRRSEFRPPIVDAIAQSTRVTVRKVVYEYQPHLAVALATKMTQPPFLIPDGWRFPWGGRHETTLLINALCVRCMYHWVAVHFGSAFNGLRGGGESSLLLVASKEMLSADIQEMSSLDLTVVRSFIQYLTYGSNTETPDPALQPIISIGNGRIAIPCLLFLSSNYERNLLSLQARIESTAFNQMSELFEDSMVGELLQEISIRWPLSKGNVTIRDGQQFEEIDLLIADMESRTVLVGELRWMLQPGDPREVQNRKKVCLQKVEQLERKINWLRPRISAALKALGITAENVDEWEMEGVVVIDTFGGTLSRKDALPIMTKQIFGQGVNHCSSLRDFATWAQSLRWLPQVGVHYRIVPNETALPDIGKKLVILGIEKLCPLHVYRYFVEQSVRSSTPELHPVGT